MNGKTAELTIVDVNQVAARLAELLAFVSRGGEVIVVASSADGEKPIARLVPPVERVPGLHKGEVWISEDFDDPLPDSFWAGDE